MIRAPLVISALIFSSVSASADSSAPTSIVRRPLETMIEIPAGTSTVGATADQQIAALSLCKKEIGTAQARQCVPNLFWLEGPARVIYLSSYSIDRVEVTVAAYRKCVQAGACDADPLMQPDDRFVQPDLPITSVTWEEASRYCAFRGARLPTESEWERAARGPAEISESRMWPWGPEPIANAANHGKFSGDDLALNLELRPDASDGFAFLAPVGSFPAGASPEGVLDLAGNALEWTADFWAEEPPQARGVVNPRGPAEGALRVVKGGSFREPLLYARTTGRDAALGHAAPPDTRSSEIGFRCTR